MESTAEENEKDKSLFYIDMDEEMINNKSSDDSMDEEVLNFKDSNVEMDFSFNFQEEDQEDEQQDLINQVLKDIKAAESGFGSEEVKEQENQFSSLFEQKQIEFLSGKVILKDILKEDGNMVAKSGEFITPKLIKRAKNQGKLISVIMNCK